MASLAAPRTRAFTAAQQRTARRVHKLTVVAKAQPSDFPLVKKAANALVAVAGVALLSVGSPAFAAQPIHELAAQAFLKEAIKDPVGASKQAAKDFQRRSDETFRDIQSSPAKTGNPEDALRPDLRSGEGSGEAYDKAASATRAVGDKLNAAPAQLGKSFDKLGAALNPDIDFNAARDKQARQADAVGRDAREKSEKVFEGLKEKLQNPLGLDRS